MTPFEQQVQDELARQVAERLRSSGAPESAKWARHIVFELAPRVAAAIARVATQFAAEIEDEKGVGKVPEGEVYQEYLNGALADALAALRGEKEAPAEDSFERADSADLGSEWDALPKGGDDIPVTFVPVTGPWRQQGSFEAMRQLLVEMVEACERGKVSNPNGDFHRITVTARWVARARAVLADSDPGPAIG